MQKLSLAGQAGIKECDESLNLGISGLKKIIIRHVIIKGTSQILKVLAGTAMLTTVLTEFLHLKRNKKKIILNTAIN